MNAKANGYNSLDKLHIQFLGKPFIATEKSNFSKTVYIRMYQKKNQKKQKETKKKKFFLKTFYYEPTYYHNANSI